MSVADNLARVRERIADAAVRAGRSPSDVTLVGVTKYIDARAAADLVRAGCLDLGESRPQELWKKFDELSQMEGLAGRIRWHLIGHLQRNKIRRTLPLVSMIHSVDSERLLAAIQEAAEAAQHDEASRGRVVKILLEVNTSGEAAKHGISPDDVQLLLANAQTCSHIEVCGLMTMAALGGGPVVAARNFAALRELRDRLRPIAPTNVRLTELSMGMSGDFEVAIAEGATIVRVGSALWD
jgi:pyridoxal phosphate enzyme (YggS family)